MAKKAQVAVCLICRQVYDAKDFGAQVDHMYHKHHAKSDDHAKEMVRLNFEPVEEV